MSEETRQQAYADTIRRDEPLDQVWRYDPKTSTAPTRQQWNEEYGEGEVMPPGIGYIEFQWRETDTYVRLKYDGCLEIYEREHSHPMTLGEPYYTIGWSHICNPLQFAYDLPAVFMLGYQKWAELQEYNEGWAWTLDREHGEPQRMALLREVRLEPRRGPSWR